MRGLIGLLLSLLVVAHSVECVDGVCVSDDDGDGGWPVRSTVASDLPDYHLMMLQDESRNQAYQSAIVEVVRGKNVLDIGSGTGLLAMMASLAGAAYVTTVERQATMVGIARKCLALNGWNNVTDDSFVRGGFGPIRLLHMESSDLSIGSHMTEPADVLVSEILDSFLIGEGVLLFLFYVLVFLLIVAKNIKGVLQATLDAKRRDLVKQNAVIIPARAKVFLQPIFSNYGMGRSSLVAGFNLEPIRGYRPNKFVGYNFGSEAPRSTALAEAQLVVEFDFHASTFPSFSRTDFVVNRTGVLNAVLLFWEVSLDVEGRFTFSNRPGVPTSWVQVRFTSQTCKILSFFKHTGINDAAR
jgi:protein arginine N-methyltransferase 7